PLDTGRLCVIRRLPARESPEVHDARGRSEAARAWQPGQLDPERRLHHGRPNLAEDRAGDRGRLAHNTGIRTCETCDFTGDKNSNAAQGGASMALGVARIIRASAPPGQVREPIACPCRFKLST